MAPGVVGGRQMTDGGGGRRLELREPLLELRQLGGVALEALGQHGAVAPGLGPLLLDHGELGVDPLRAPW